MNRTFIETPAFTRKWEEAGLTDDDLLALQNILMENPKAGTVVPGAGGIRKIRISVENKGKRGGGRVIYFDIDIKEKIYLLDVYVKNEKTNLTETEKKILRKLAQALKGE